MSAFIESWAVLPAGGLENPASSARIGQWRVGGIVSYPIGDLALFGSTFRGYDFTRTRVVRSPGQTALSEDRTAVRLGDGIRVVGSEQVWANFEHTMVKGSPNVDADAIGQ